MTCSMSCRLHLGLSSEMNQIWRPQNLLSKIIIECKKPKRKDGIEQLKSYMNAKGAPVAVWSNGSDSIILYRPYPKEFDDTLFDIPKRIP